jgi:hypothetical protein
MVLVDQPSKLEAMLMGWVRQATEPPILGVKVQSVTKTGAGEDKGFVVCFIPPSPWKPHRAKWPEARQTYYMRVTDHSIPIPHSTLKSLFFPNYLATIEIWAEISTEIGRVFSWTINLSSTNRGPATAADLLLVREIPNKDFSDGHFHPISMWHQVASGFKGQTLQAQRDIHPGETMPFFKGMLGEFVDVELIVITVRVFLRNQDPLRLRLKIPKAELPQKKRYLAMPIDIEAS